jgi:hypothetical protein
MITYVLLMFAQQIVMPSSGTVSWTVVGDDLLPVPAANGSKKIRASSQPSTRRSQFEVAAAGVPVLLEKPPATAAAALSELAVTADRNGVLTGVGMNFRWATPVRRLHALLTDPQHGGPSVITVRHSPANRPHRCGTCRCGRPSCSRAIADPIRNGCVACAGQVGRHPSTMADQPAVTGPRPSRTSRPSE